MSVFALSLQAQRKFRNLTADEVKIDSVLPMISYSFCLPEGHEDSTYTLKLLYPEFLVMAQSEVEAYKKLRGEVRPGAMPEVEAYIAYARKKPMLTTSFCPVVFRDGRYQYLVSFLPQLGSAERGGRPEDNSSGTVAACDSEREGFSSGTVAACDSEGEGFSSGTVATCKAKGADSSSGTAAGKGAKGAVFAARASAERYAEHSVLAEGRWAKIRVSETGIHELTADVIRKAGFSNMDKVKIYGYGGNLVPEVLTDSYLRECDDLSEVATCTVGGRCLFYAKGPVSWSSATTTVRTRNPYSDYGYYFITENDGAPKTCTEQELMENVTKSNDIYHILHEKDEYAWYNGGRNLCESAPISAGSSKTYEIQLPPVTGATATVSFAANANGTQVKVYQDDVLKSTSTIKIADYDKAMGAISSLAVPASEEGKTLRVKIENLGPGAVRLDNIAVAMRNKGIEPDINADKLPAAEFVYNITNQDLHADRDYDMVIIIPTSQKTRQQAERLKAFHEEHDGLKVRIVPADELYNEFSSGTPDASAYRRYMKMLYDRAENAEKAPRYLLLFGDCTFDNRMLTSGLRSESIDDYLLCFESENSYNEVYCYVSDDFFTMLDDGESISTGDYYRGIPDVAVGRFTCTTADQAKVFVDKTINYATSSPSGSWQNTLMFLGDDGNNNIHMRDVNEVADYVIRQHPGYYVRKVMWDAYKRESSSTGHRYPEVTKILKQQQAEGALLIDYAGHGSEISISHEAALVLKDFEDFRGSNLPLWITASCDIMPFDGNAQTIGETAVMNPNGGAVAFYGTTRTVYSSYNKIINSAFVKNVLSYDANGKPMSIGEANRKTKEYLVTSGSDITVNKMQYALIGDPVLSLALPSLTLKVDSINDVAVSAGNAEINAGKVVKIKGHVEGANGRVETFNGLLNAMVRDTEELVVCRLNNDDPKDGAQSPFTYTDRRNILFQGADSIKNGTFTFLFAVPKDINYTEGTGMLNLYAVNNEHTLSAHGACDSFLVKGSEISENDSIGPSIYCYLNSPEFSYGGTVNSTPYFVAEISDKDGINASGAGIGHDMQLIIDGDISKTYNLNDNFQYDFGSYTSGQTYYVLPQLEEGKHYLTFRAWDILNNSSVSTLAFEVKKGLKPALLSVGLARNPVRDNARFVITHDRAGAEISVEIEVMDTSGRLLWSRTETAISSGNRYESTWNLTLDNGSSLDTGVYLYRIKLCSDGSEWSSKAKKMVVIR